jgi:hypothetical protein
MADWLVVIAKDPEVVLARLGSQQAAEQALSTFVRICAAAERHKLQVRKATKHDRTDRG